MAGTMKHAPGECCGHEVEAPEIYPVQPERAVTVATFCRLAASRFPVTLYLPHKPRGDQFKYFNLSSRHTVGVIGRQYGKSTLATLRMVRKITSTKDANHYWFPRLYRKLEHNLNAY